MLSYTVFLIAVFAKNDFCITHHFSIKVMYMYFLAVNANYLI